MPHRKFASSSLGLMVAATACDAPTPVTGDAPVLSLHPDRVVELAFVAVTPGRETQLFETYFPQVMPIVDAYGGRALAQFTVNEVRGGDPRAQTIGLFEWPSVDAFLAIGQDVRLPPLLELRNEALSYIEEANFFRVPQAIEIPLDERFTYELHAVWFEDTSTTSSTNILAALETQARDHGVSFSVRLDLDPDSIGPHRPRHVFLRIWPNRDAAMAFDPVFDPEGVVRHERRWAQWTAP